MRAAPVDAMRATLVRMMEIVLRVILASTRWCPGQMPASHVLPPQPRRLEAMSCAIAHAPPVSSGQMEKNALRALQAHTSTRMGQLRAPCAQKENSASGRMRRQSRRAKTAQALPALLLAAQQQSSARASRGISSPRVGGASQQAKSKARWNSSGSPSLISRKVRCVERSWRSSMLPSRACS